MNMEYRDVKLSVMLTQEEEEAIEQAAKKLMLGKSQLARIAIANYIKGVKK